MAAVWGLAGGAPGAAAGGLTGEAGAAAAEEAGGTAVAAVWGLGWEAAAILVSAALISRIVAPIRLKRESVSAISFWRVSALKPGLPLETITTFFCRVPGRERT
ncbi:hypothetical protein FACS189468_0860 [Spirochaetia bacterium]|nr:hypothetical protein FACS189468_0860 [Spirochaetia bacterium]